jgi:hypothetical protein
VALVLTAGVTSAQLPAATGSRPAGQHPQVQLRFHHLHYRVADPGAALGDAADAFQGTRTIQQGLGVGVRVGREYVLFDRQSDGGEPARVEAAGAYAEAVSWLKAHGVGVEPPSLAGTAFSRGWRDGTLDHVAFAARDLPPAAAVLPATPVSTTEDRVLYRLPTGLGVEIVRDTDLPDTWWCPMHPDVRAPGAATCPICAMALVPIPPPRVGEFKLDVAVTPRPGGGAAGLSLAIRDPDTGDPVTRFIEVHERQLHLFVISRDLERFDHVHPERRDDGTFELRHELPAGEYMLIADFLPANGTMQMLQRAIVTPGFSGPLFAPAPTPAVSPVERTVGGLRIRVEHEVLRPRRESLLRFVVSDAESGQPVTDLEPYLGATGHLLIVDTQLSTAVHGHPEGVRTTGPLVMFGPVFPAPGLYKMWVQLQRRGQIITAPFVVRVAEP